MNFVVGTILDFLVNVMVCVTIILLPQYYQGVMHYTASLTGLALVSRVVAYVALFFIGKLCQLYDLRLLIASGFVFFGTSIAMCANLNLQSSPMAIILSNIFFGIGSVFALVPISALALGTLPKDKIPDAAGIHSLLKCVTGSMFTSLASSFAISLSQVHQTYLLKNMSVYNPVFVKHFSVLKGFFMYNLPSISVAKKANAMLYKQLFVQVKLSAFADLFQFAALVTFLVIPLVLLLKVDFSKQK